MEVRDPCKWRPIINTRPPARTFISTTSCTSHNLFQAICRTNRQRESHDLWGRRHLLTIVYREIKPFVSLDHWRITLAVRPGSGAQKRAEVVHEMVHLIEPTHSDRFLTILGEHYPTWREARAELNELPLAAEVWKE